MGINVAGKTVSYTDVHQQLVNTDPTSNPSFTVIRKLTIHSIFRRERHNSLSGDGNPLMYALKGKNNYSIDLGEILKFLPNFYQIVDKYLPETEGVNIVPMPSSHKISLGIARRIQRRIPNSALAPDLLLKRNCLQVYEDLSGIESPPKSYEFKQLLASLKKTPELPFSLKEVDTKLRKHTKPLALNGSLPIAGAPVLLVDDLLATGTTLVCARDLLCGADAGLKVSGLCLLSRLAKG